VFVTQTVMVPVVMVPGVGNEQMRWLLVAFGAACGAGMLVSKQIMGFK
jgi:hypothetical protein